MPDPKTVTPAYVPFKTFTAVLDSFKSFLPDRIDTSMWPSYSGGIRSQLLGSLRFLRLIADDGVPTEALRQLTHADPAQRNALFVGVMKAAYGSLMSLDLTKATPGSFDAEMRKFGQEGDTHRKAASFFLQAAKWAGVPLSPLLTKKGSLVGSRRKRVSNGAAKGGVPAAVKIQNAALDYYGAGSKKETTLAGGYRLLIASSVDLFQMTAEDRKFVMGLLEKIETYESEHGDDLEEGAEEEGTED